MKVRLYKQHDGTLLVVVKRNLPHEGRTQIYNNVEQDALESVVADAVQKMRVAQGPKYLQSV